MTNHPWPLSELDADEAAALAALPPKFRDARIRRLKTDILDGTHARRKLRRMLEANAAPAISTNPHG